MIRRVLFALFSLVLIADFSPAKADGHAGGVIVFGGNGRTGAMIVERLLAKGEDVRVFVRPTSD